MRIISCGTLMGRVIFEDTHAICMLVCMSAWHWSYHINRLFVCINDRNVSNIWQVALKYDIFLALFNSDIIELRIWDLVAIIDWRGQCPKGNDEASDGNPYKCVGYCIFWNVTFHQRFEILNKILNHNATDKHKSLPKITRYSDSDTQPSFYQKCALHYVRLILRISWIATRTLFLAMLQKDCWRKINKDDQSILLRWRLQKSTLFTKMNQKMSGKCRPVSTSNALITWQKLCQLV